MTALQWKKYLASAALITMTFTSAGIAMASPGERQDMQEVHGKVQKIMDDHRKATEGTMKQLLVKEAELKGQMGSVNPDSAKIESLSKDIGELKGKLLVDRVKMNQDFAKEGLPTQKGMHMQGWGDDCGDRGDRSDHRDSRNGGMHYDKKDRPHRMDHMN